MRELMVPVAEGVSDRVLLWPEGDGVPFLLVHGLASNALLWRGVAERLNDLGHPVAAVDQRGHGRSDKPDHGYDFATVTADLVALIRALAFDRPVVAGQSWGGNVVIDLAHRHPEVLRGVVGVDGGTIELASRFGTWDECASSLAPPRFAGTPYDRFESLIRSMHPDWPEVGIAGTLANAERRPDGTVAPWLTFDRHMAILRELYHHRPSQLLPEITVPVLLVPARDGFLGELSVPDGIEVSPMDGDHDLHAQHPRQLADLLSAWAGEHA